MTGFSPSTCFSPARTSAARKRHHPPSAALQRLQAVLASLGHLAAKLRHLKQNKMVVVRGSRAGDEMGRGDRDEALWQRAILMGDKCQPLDFSGVIYYDERGKQVLEPPSRSPRSPLPRSPLPGYLHAR
uniref:Uncharacterized protein n=1 Tax=Kalanchoe fedtschenkoi TaxID=63787 RepID=A0A7N1A800_KALFE